jgi:hypothetical protein
MGGDLAVKWAENLVWLQVALLVVLTVVSWVA